MLSKGLIGLIVLALVVIVGTKLYMKTQPVSNTDKPTKAKVITPTLTPLSLKTIGWIPYWDQKNAFESFSNNAQFFDFVSVFWYRIDAFGNLKTYKSTIVDQSIIDFAHQNKVRILAVVANMADYGEEGNWDAERVDLVISSPQSRSNHISDLVALAENNNFDGIDIDYEALKPSQRENFSLFVEELAEKLHQKSKLLGVAIHPRTQEFNPDEDGGSQAQNLARISKAADHMYFMNYTEHNIFSQPGPAASIDWDKRVMDYALNDAKIPPEKIFFGIGLFGLEWRQEAVGSFEGENDDLTFGQIQTLVQKNNIKVDWDDNAKSPHFEYQKSGEKYVVWFENAQSVAERIGLAKELKVGGIAFWRLGGEDPLVWQKVREFKQN